MRPTLSSRQAACVSMFTLKPAWFTIDPQPYNFFHDMVSIYNLYIIKENDSHIKQILFNF